MGATQSKAFFSFSSSRVTTKSSERVKNLFLLYSLFTGQNLSFFYQNPQTVAITSFFGGKKRVKLLIVEWNLHLYVSIRYCSVIDIHFDSRYIEWFYDSLN